ncbi:MAG: hypothetical protein K2W91_01985 [Novosphingobium sp.]|nr:hypothetical protein [Novosphingobium sp.]
MRIATALFACLALAACQDEPKKETGGTAQGEILPGSASDAMLPLDTVKSQAPLAPKVEGGDKADPKKADQKADPAAGEAAPAEEDVPAAAEEPAGE